jgi:hypothetical protein
MNRMQVRNSVQATVESEVLALISYGLSKLIPFFLVLSPGRGKQLIA